MAEDPMAALMALQTEEAEPVAAVVSFPAPQGFKAPDNVLEDDLFEVVAKVRLEDGQFVVDSVNGMKIDGSAPEVEEVEEIEEVEEPTTLMGAAKASGY